MKVFISWSGKRSKEFAEFFKIWIKELLPGVEPMTSEDIETGTAWAAGLREMLKEADFGLVTLTANNFKELWLYYEAGFISGKFAFEGEPRICPFVVDKRLKRGKLPSPLSQFNGVCADKKNEVLRLVRDLYRAGGEPQLDPPLEVRFEQKWGELQAKLKAVWGPRGITEVYERVAEDYEKVSGFIEDHRKRLAAEYDQIIEETVAQFPDYDPRQVAGRFFDLLERSTQFVPTYRSKLLKKNVREFMAETYTPDDIIQVLLKMKPTLDDRELGREAKIEALREQSRIAELEAFQHLHRLLSEKLTEFIDRKKRKRKPKKKDD